MVVGGGGQVRIKGETRWRRRDVSNKRPGVPTLAIWDGDILGYSHTEQYLGGEYISKSGILRREQYSLWKHFCCTICSPWQQMPALTCTSCKEDNLQSADLAKLKRKSNHLAALPKKPCILVEGFFPLPESSVRGG